MPITAQGLVVGDTIMGSLDDRPDKVIAIFTLGNERLIHRQHGPSVRVPSDRQFSVLR